MTIATTDIKFLESKKMTDTTDGGGEMTAREIQDGELGNLWPDISRLDRTLGAVEFRKIFLAVRSVNPEIYSGTHAIIDAPPQDPLVNMFLMSFKDHYDNRTEARNRVESFTIKSGLADVQLDGRQIAGQTELKMWAHTGRELPKLGDTLVLIENGDTNTEQYIKVKNINYTAKTFTYFINNGYSTFSAVAVIISTTEKLERDYQASSANPLTENATAVFKTQPSTSSDYYACRPLTKAAAADTLSIKVDKIEQSLVPVATIEKAVVDLPVSSGVALRKITDAKINLSTKTGDSGDNIWYLPRAVTPGSLELTISSAQYRDDGGELVLFSGSSQFTKAPQVNYATGQINYSANAANRLTDISFSPAMANTQALFTEAAEVTEITRGLNWTFNLNPVPAPNTVSVRYLYGDDWVELKDNGAGILEGTGSGTVNYTTGSVLVTAAALPELGSAVLVSWMNDNLQPATQPPTVAADIVLGMSTIAAAGALTVDWTASSTARSMSTVGYPTGLTGEGTGTIELSGRTALARIQPSTLPDDGVYNVTYNAFIPAPATETVVVGALAYDDAATTLDIQLVGNIEANSLSFTLTLARPNRRQLNGFLGGTTVSYIYTYHKVSFIAGGSNIYLKGAVNLGAVGTLTGNLISLNMAAMTFKCTDTIQTDRGPAFKGAYQYTTDSTAYEYRRASVSAGAVVFKYMQTGAALEQRVEQVTAKLVALIPEDLVLPGTTVFSIAGQYYYDDKDGRLITNYDAQTGAGITAGSINHTLYGSEIVLNTPPTPNPVITPISATRRDGLEVEPMNAAFFYLEDTPIRPGTVQIMFNNFEGDKIILKADSAGVLFEHDRDASGLTIGAVMPNVPGITLGGIGYGRSGSLEPNSDPWGQIDYETGQIIINFRDAIPPQLVSINSVQAATIPLDSDIIGLNAVRMPSTGRVPVFKDGSMLVIHDTQFIDAGTPAADQVFDLLETDLASVSITDSLGAYLDPLQYTTDLALGVVTMNNPLVLQTAAAVALVPPLKITRRIEAMTLCSDVSLDGTLSLATPLPRAMPITSLVSSAAVAGDVQARAYGVFSQTTDQSGVFMIEGSGTPTNAQLNDLDYPIEITPRGAVSDRWKIKFKSTSAYDVFSERRGLVLAGSIVEDLAPINSVTGDPYFIIRAAAWGSGWATGNILRFDTDPAAVPLWCIRSIQPGKATVENDSFSLQARGDTDK